MHLRKLKGCNVLNKVRSERGTIGQYWVYERGTFSTENDILKGKGLLPRPQSLAITGGNLT